MRLPRSSTSVASLAAACCVALASAQPGAYRRSPPLRRPRRAESSHETSSVPHRISPLLPSFSTVWVPTTNNKPPAGGGVVVGSESVSQQLVCAATAPGHGLNASIDLAVPGKWEAFFSGAGACDVATFSAGKASEINAPTFSLLQASPQIIWGPRVPDAALAAAGAVAVTHPLGLSFLGQRVTVCRALHPTQQPPTWHAGRSFGANCTFSWGGGWVTVAGYDSLWWLSSNSSGLNQSAFAPTPPPASPSASATPSLSPTPSLTITPFQPGPGPDQVWLEPAKALAAGYKAQHFMQSGTDGTAPVYVCRGEVASGYLGYFPSASPSAWPSMLPPGASPSTSPQPAALALQVTNATSLTHAPLGAPADALDERLAFYPAGMRVFAVMRTADALRGGVAVYDVAAAAPSVSKPFIGIAIGKPSDVNVATSLGLLLVTSDAPAGGLFAYSLTPPHALAWSVTIPGADHFDWDDVAQTAWVASYAAPTSVEGAVTKVVCSPSGGTITAAVAMPLGTGRPTDVQVSPSSAMLFVASVSPSAPATAIIYGIKRTPAVPSIFMQNTVPGDQTTQGASLAFDAANSRLLWARGATLLVINAADLEVSTSVSLGAVPPADHVVFDPAARVAYVSCSGGALVALQQTSAPAAYSLMAAPLNLAQPPLASGANSGVAVGSGAAAGAVFLGAQALAGVRDTSLLTLRVAPVAAPAKPALPLLPPVMPGRYDPAGYYYGMSVNCLTPFNPSDFASFGPSGSVVYKVLLSSPTLAWQSSVSAAAAALGRPVMSGSVAGRNASVCRAWRTCQPSDPWWRCQLSGPHAGYFYPDDPPAAQACTFSYSSSNSPVVVSAPNFDALLSFASAQFASPLPGATVLPVPSPTPSPTTSTSTSVSPAPPVPGVAQWVPQGAAADSVFAGTENGNSITVCRGLYNNNGRNELIPGKRVGSSPYCDIPEHNVELLDQVFDALRNNPRLTWVASNVTATLSPFWTRVDQGMSYNGDKVAVCRAPHPVYTTTVHSGFTDGALYGGVQLCFFSWGGSVKSNSVFDVLYMAPAPSPTPTPSNSPSATLTPQSASPTPTVSGTPNPSNTPSNTRTPSETRTPTRSPTKTPSSSITSTPSRSIGASQTPTISITSSPTSTVSASASVKLIDPGFKLQASDGSASGVVLIVFTLLGIVGLVVACAVVMRPKRAAPTATRAAAGGAAAAAGAADAGAEGERVSIRSADATAWAAGSEYSYGATAGARR